jgi:cation diffusion facilitator family transporter
METDRLKRGLRVTFIGMIVNTVLAVGKTVAGVVGHSHALVADGVESLADVFSSVIVWRGLVVAEEPADKDHPYGHGKAEPIAAAVVATMLVFAAIWIGITAVREILTPHSMPAPFTLVVLILVVVVKETLFRRVMQESMSLESTAVKTDAWHHRSDALTSLAAAIGIAVALIGGPGYEAADDWAALFAAGIIAWNGSRLFRTAADELMDMKADPEVEQQVRKVGEAVEGVREIEKCLIRKAGHHYFVDIHVQVDPQMTVVRAHDIAHQVKDRIKASLPQVRDVLVHIEPHGHQGND